MPCPPVLPCPSPSPKRSLRRQRPRPKPRTDSTPVMPNIPGLSPEMMKKLAEARAAYDSWQKKGTKRQRQRRSEWRRQRRSGGRICKGHPEVAEAMKEPEEKFIPCESFEGKKDGFCFKMGDEGLGYYWDAVAKGGRIKSYKASKTKSAASAPVIQKETSSNEASKFLPLPEYTFRQDRSTLSY